MWCFTNGGKTKDMNDKSGKADSTLKKGEILYYLYGQFGTIMPKITIGVFDDYDLLLDAKEKYENKVPYVYWDEIQLNEITKDIELALTGDTS